MKKWISKAILVLMTLAAITIWYEVVISPDTSGVIIKFCDVGQGDAALIQKGDIQILIDGGPDEEVLSCIGEIMPSYDKKIDYIILSHPHADHLVGINVVVDRYEIGKIYYSGVEYESNQYQKFLDALAAKNLDKEVPEKYDVVIPFKNADFEFLWPGEKYNKETSDDLNATSEVARFCYFDHCVLFTGDAEAEDGIYANIDSAKLSVEILKVPHHGSSSGVDQSLLDAVGAHYAIISVGEGNSYGHPAKSTLDLLGQYQLTMLRTDRDGSITFTISEDGNGGWTQKK
jgi:competence protein ComEC